MVYLKATYDCFVHGSMVAASEASGALLEKRNSRSARWLFLCPFRTRRPRSFIISFIIVGGGQLACLCLFWNSFIPGRGAEHTRAGTRSSRSRWAAGPRLLPAGNSPNSRGRKSMAIFEENQCEPSSSTTASPNPFPDDSKCAIASVISPTTLIQQ